MSTFLFARRSLSLDVLLHLLLMLLSHWVAVLVEPLAVPTPANKKSQNVPKPTLVQHDIVYTDKGIMSLALLPPLNNNEKQERKILAGTKRGTLVEFAWDPVAQSCTCQGEIIHTNHASEKSTSIPYPIYSLQVFDNKYNNNKLQIFCGSGDRYIKVMESTSTSIESSDDGENDDPWHFTQQLGPHTGWVKALAMDNDEEEEQPWLHSIGCNCIETWKQQQSSEERWTHCTKRSIESSPNHGSTLSSDLLCLVTWNGFLCAGGVDGRIHVWPSHPEPLLSSIGAHQGRVNALAILPTTASASCMLLSTGHDGELQCRMLRTGKQPILLTDQPVATLAVVDHDGAPLRISSLACTPLQLSEDKNTTARILLGTTNGLVVNAILRNTDNQQWTVTEQSRVQLQDDGQNDLDPIATISVNAIEILSPPHQQQQEEPVCAALVGHSKGLSVIHLHHQR
ncbi:expressed unknown protein [Seminavis robusta]|uniref:Uncharacterized protein n=1 Tax=Seminavis robusta TaxID=568900 RepID=A0A9N8HTL6_9STRA|nr:expressed unknown protein [Seminavis robusta]|eukprot:Sro1528_g279970.1 n/a (454) ;mRNA; f:11520-12881